MNTTRHPIAALIGSAAAIALVTLAAVWVPSTQASPSTSAIEPSADDLALAAMVERGRYLSTVTGCSDCHTPKVMGPNGPTLDESRLLAGHPDGAQLPPPPAAVGPWIAAGTCDLTAWSGPWGISYAANLTPDKNTGLGIWTEDMFVRALRTGRHMGQSRPILPPMPWEQIREMSDDDLEAVFAYLQSLPPVHNRVPEPLPPAGAEEQDPTWRDRRARSRPGTSTRSGPHRRARSTGTPAAHRRTGSSS